MRPAPLGPDEERRLAALGRYAELDLERDPAFLELVAVATRVCRAPIGFVSLVEAERERLEACVGIDLREAPREAAFCSHTIVGEGRLVVPDLAADPRFADNPFVAGPPHARFYAGVPIRSPDGFPLGALCVVDVVPRELPEEDGRALEALARLVEQRLELRRQLGRDSLDLAAAAAERERARAELARAVSLLTATLEATDDGLLVVDAHGSIVSVNRRFAELWRIPEELLAAREARLVRDHLIAQLRRPAQFEDRLRELAVRPEGESHDLLECRDGRVFEQLSRPQRIAGGVAGRVWSVRDVTRRHRGERARNAAYRISQAASTQPLLADLFRSVHEAIKELMPADDFFIAIVDPQRGLLTFPYFVDRYDPPPAPRPLGRGLTEYLLRTGRPLFVSPERFAELVAKGEVESIGAPSYDWLGVPLAIEHGTDGALVVQTYEPGVRYSEGDLELLAFVSSQVALAIRRKRAEEELGAREARLRLMMAQLPAVLWSTDRDLRFLSSEGSGLASLGLRPHEVVGRRLPEFFGTDDPDFPALAAHRRALAGEPTTYEQEWAGRRFAIHLEPLRDEGGTVVGTLGLAIDVTEQRTLESQLQMAQKMEAVGRLAGGVAHDFNNLLSTILGYSELALEQLPEGSPVRGEITEIHAAGERAAALTRQLLAFGRRQPTEPRVLDLDAQIREASKMLQRLLGERVALELRLGAAAAAIRADAGQIVQVVVNLSVNARDAMPQGGTVVIETSTLELTAAERHGAFEIPAGAYVALTVSDVGVGMGDETLAHLFEPFYTTKETGKGTGLGLATVYGIVKQSEGYITVDSQPGFGSNFRVYFPRVAAAPEAPPQAPTAAPVRTPSGTILLVEDEEGLRSLARRTLERLGYVVLEVGCAEGALELERQHAGAIDLLLTDVIMPGLDGAELARRLLERRPGLRVLFVSGYPDDSLGEGVVLRAGTPFLAKPFTPTSLARKVDEILGRGS